MPAPTKDETHLNLLVRVSWMYYIEGLKQEDIANALGLSRMKINRLLASAREEGIVTIDIRPTVEFSGDLTQRLRDRFELQEVHIVPRAATSSAAVASVGYALGSYLNDRLRDGMTIGVSSGRSVHSLINGLRPQQFSGMDIVSMTGCLSNEGKGTPYEVVTRLAQVLEANAYQLAAPCYALSQKEFELFNALPMVEHVLDRARAADMAIFTASRVDQDSGLVEYGFITLDEMKEISRAGAVASVLGVFIDTEGNEIAGGLNARQIGIGMADLRRIPNRIMVCAGENKIAALTAALRLKAANILFTDEATASAVLDRPNAPLAGKRTRAKS